MSIFLLLVASIGYFMYRWYEVVQEVNIINSRTIEGVSEDNVNLTALASIHQPCVANLEISQNNPSNPICNSSFGLTCVTGMYLGNGDGTNTGVCLSNIGSYCDTIYDCVPSAQGCINNICENLSETINLPCTYDSDCIGESTCTHCINSSGPCKNTATGVCYELVNGECPNDIIDTVGNPVTLQLCNSNTFDNNVITSLNGEFEYNHICDTSLEKPLCKYNLSPKDQGCTADSDCAQLEGGTICYRGSFKTSTNPNGTLTPPTYYIADKGVIEANTTDGFGLNSFSLKILNSTGFLVGFQTITNPNPGGTNAIIDITNVTDSGEILNYNVISEGDGFTEATITVSDGNNGSAQLVLSNICIIEIDFDNSLLTVNSFEVGTEVNFILSDVSRTSLSYGPYYIREQFNNNMVTLSDSKLQPAIAEFLQFPNNNIQLNQNQYKLGNPVSYSAINSQITKPTFTKIVFGMLPALQILSFCYWDKGNFVLYDNDSTFKLQPLENVLEGTTQVRFNINTNGTTDGNVNDARPYVLEKVNADGSFTVTPTPDHLESYNSSKTPLQVMFGYPQNTDLLNENKGVCVTKLPPSANISTDSKYDLTNYTGNPCISLYDNSIAVSPNNGFCELQNVQSGPGSVCQFSRTGIVNGKSQIFDPLPCDKTSIVYEGITYQTECLLDDALTETMRNNPNYLNSSYTGICAYPVHNKFKSCDLYNNNCRQPYVCTEFEGGYFCDSRFDVLQCNNAYVCPPTFSCSDGTCLSVTGGYCVSNENCLSGNCGKKVYLSFYNSIMDTDTQVPKGETGNSFNKSNINNNLVLLTDIDVEGYASDYTLIVSSKYDPTLITYAFAYKTSSPTTCVLYEIAQPTGKNPVNTVLSIPSKSNFQSKFTFDNVYQTLYTYSVSNSNLNLFQIYPTEKVISVPSVTGTITSIQIYNGDLLITSSQNATEPFFVNLDVSSTPQSKNYIVTKIVNFDSVTPTTTTYDLPYFSATLDNLQDCNFDLLNVNDSELDIVCVHNPTEFETPVLGVRHKIRSYSQGDKGYFKSLFEGTTPPSNCDPTDSSKNQIGCFLNPIISSLSSTETLPNQTTTIPYLYLVSNPSDINSIYAFSNNTLTIGGVNVKTMYKTGSRMYLELDGELTTTTNVPLVPTISTSNYVAFSFSPSSNLENYGTALEPYLEYPYWIEDLQDLVVGDNFNPQIQRIFYQPDRINRNFYAIVNMFTGYNNSVETKIIETSQNIELNNTYLFKFSSLNNEKGLIVNETLPIRVNGPTDIERFSQCNQTQNMFFLTNQCS